MPILVGARQARCLEREDRTDLPHSHVAHKGLEVVALGRQLSRLAEIPVEDSDLLRSPTQRLCLVRQIVLALGALLIETHLRRCRLPNVDAGVPRQMMIGNGGFGLQPALSAATYSPRRQRSDALAIAAKRYRAGSSESHSTCGGRS